MLNSSDPLLLALSLETLTSEQLPPQKGQRLLRFPLANDSALLPLEQIEEIIGVNLTQILPGPEMPSCVLGIANWRGEMLWFVDLNHLIGFPSLLEHKQVLKPPVAIVIEVNDQNLGLVVQQVNDIELHDLQQLRTTAPGLFPAKLMPFVLGTLPGVNGFVLDFVAITQCPLWKIHQGGAT